MKFITLKDRTVATMFGHTIEFKGGVPTHVPEVCWAAVQAAGAVPEGELPDDAAALPAAPSGTEREKLLIDAMKGMVVRGSREDFTASGAPAAAPLSALVGFTVSSKERDEAWVKAQAGDED